MKKLSTIFIIISFLFSTQTYAFACMPDVHKVTTTIDNASYDPDMDETYFNSVEDAEGGFWSFIIEDDTDAGLSIEALTVKYKGVTIEIYYVGSLEKNDIEIVTSNIIGGK